MPRGVTTTKICNKCEDSYSLFVFSRHYKSCKGNKKYIPYIQSGGDSLICRFCKKLCKSPSGRGVHEVQCRMNPNSVSIQKGRVAWNKGKAKPDTRDQRYVGKIGGYRENAGISKKFKVYDSYGNLTTLQSTYEYACFEILLELSVNWVRPRALKYDDKNYFADFYLPDFNIWIDTKNDYKYNLDKSKIKKVTEQNNVRLYVLLKEHINKLTIASII